MVDEKKIQAVIDQIYEGKSITTALASLNIKARDFHKALASTPSLEILYERAQAARAEILAEEIVSIADTEEDSQKARNMIDARKWYSSKMKPAKFGDRIDVNVTQVVDIGAALAEARSRASLPIRYPQSTTVIESTEYKEVNEDKPSDSESDPNENEWEEIFK